MVERMSQAEISNGDSASRDKLRRAAIVAFLLTAIGAAADPRPIEFLIFVVEFGAVVLAVILVVRYFRRNALARVPTRFTESRSRPIRAVIKLARGYAVYLVAGYTVIAVLGLFTIINHFVG
jgi:small-conductance mechanosensitive channel